MSIPDWQVEGTMEHAQREALEKALKDTHFAVSRAAAKLRIGRSTVYRLIKRYDIAVSEKQDGSAPDCGTAAASHRPQNASKLPGAATSSDVIFDGQNYLLKRR